jgi:N-methylhydantoinase B
MIAAARVVLNLSYRRRTEDTMMARQTDLTSSERTVTPTAATGRRFDPFTLEVLWTRAIAIADEMAATLTRTAYSTIIRVNLDFACGIFDRRGELIAQATHCAPGQLGAMPTVMYEFLKIYPSDALESGDVLITNDPWIGAGHSPDIYVATPIFVEDRLVGFACNSAHHMDVGGSLRSDTRDVLEEGLLIPVCKLYEAGRENDMLMRLIRRNVRLPEKTMGDMRAQLAANYIAAERILQLLEEYQLEGLEDLADAIAAQTEASMRTAIQQIPDGTYSLVYPIEERSRYGESLEIRVAITVVGDRVTVDFTGTSGQVERPINCVLNYTRSYVVVGLKMALCPDLPYNPGIQRPVELIVPEANLLNAKFPIAIWWRTAVGQLIPEIIFAALAPAVPERVIAGCGSVPMWLYFFQGYRRNGERVHEGSHAMGGLGARHGKDGLSTVAFPLNLADTPSEVIESEADFLLVDGREFTTDSGGPGRYRGGLGQRLTLRVSPEVASKLSGSLLFSASRARYEQGPVGLLGGQPGSRGAICVNGELLPFELQDIEVYAGDRITLQLPGGGGMHPPFERSLDAVERDVSLGYVSVSGAYRDYGVVIDERSLCVDSEATASLRRSISARHSANTD